MKVKDVMTTQNLKSCSPETKLQEVAKFMKSANCGALPVIDRNKKVVGIITDRDIALSLSQKNYAKHAEIPVKEIMGKKVNTVNENDEIDTALNQMRTKHIGRLPVVDQEDKLKGILSISRMVSKSPEILEQSGNSSQNGESVLKTIQALSERNSGIRQNENSEKSYSHAI